MKAYTKYDSGEIALAGLILNAYGWELWSDGPLVWAVPPQEVADTSRALGSGRWDDAFGEHPSSALWGVVDLVEKRNPEVADANDGE